MRRARSANEAVISWIMPRTRSSRWALSVADERSRNSLKMALRFAGTWMGSKSQRLKSALSWATIRR